ncbi:MAG: hypothetical protein ACOYYJ_13650 [Chloroflexota bacterium]
MTSDENVDPRLVPAHPSACLIPFCPLTIPLVTGMPAGRGLPVF